MRTLIVSQYFHPENFGINSIAYDLAKFGYHVTVLTGKPNYPSGRIAPGYRRLWVQREIDQGVMVLRVPLIPRGNGSFWRLALNYLSFAFAASVLAPFLLRGPIDTIFVYQVSPLTVGLPALWIGWIKRAPIVFWVQDIWPQTLIAVSGLKSAAILRMIRLLAVFIYRRCRMILIQSRAFEAEIRAFGVENADIRYFPNTVPDYYIPVEPALNAPESKPASKRFKVLFAGNIGVSQGFETILGAAELLRDNCDIQWLIAGDGRLKPWVAAQIAQRKLRDNVHLLGQQPSEQMPHFFAASDVLLVTLAYSSISGLTVPSKLQSYLACGRPIIGSINGEAAKIIVESGAGLVCSPGNPKELADAVLALHAMTPAQRQKLGNAGRHYFEQCFGRTELIRKLATWLAEASCDRKFNDMTRQPAHDQLHESRLDQV